MELFDLAANPEVTDINTVPPDFRAMYVQKDGKYNLDSENAVVKSAVAVFAGAAQALKASRAEVKAAKAKAVDLTPLSIYGNTPTEIAAAIEATKKGWEDKLPNIEKIKEGIQKEWQPKLELADRKNKALSDKLFKHLVLGDASQALAAAKGDVDLLVPFVQEQVKVKDVDGDYQVHVVDAAGETRYGGTGNPMTIKELVAEMKSNAKYGKLFESETVAGTGHGPRASAPKVGAAAAAASRTREEMSPTEKIRSGLKKGLAIKPNAA